MLTDVMEVERFWINYILILASSDHRIERVTKNFHETDPSFISMIAMHVLVSVQPRRHTRPPLQGRVLARLVPTLHHIAGTLPLYHRDNYKIWNLELLNLRIYKMQHGSNRDLKQQMTIKTYWLVKTELRKCESSNMWPSCQALSPQQTTTYSDKHSISPSDVTNTQLQRNSQSLLPQQNTRVHHIIKIKVHLKRACTCFNSSITNLQPIHF